MSLSRGAAATRVVPPSSLEVLARLQRTLDGYATHHDHEPWPDDGGRGAPEA